VGVLFKSRSAQLNARKGVADVERSICRSDRASWSKRARDPGAIKTQNLTTTSTASKWKPGQPSQARYYHLPTTLLHSQRCLRVQDEIDKATGRIGSTHVTYKASPPSNLVQSSAKPPLLHCQCLGATRLQGQDQGQGQARGSPDSSLESIHT
jgi:hypothetical protein